MRTIDFPINDFLTSYNLLGHYNNFPICIPLKCVTEFECILYPKFNGEILTGE